jgi:hypothetical protein
MKALMIDIETLGLAPTSLAHQIGFCAADLFTGEYLLHPTNIFVAPQAGTSMDFNTICWWMNQSDAARAAVYPPEQYRIPAALVFYQLKEAYENLGGKDAGVTVWASPAMFDLPILTHAFGIARPDLNEAKPWPYYMERDLMTLYKMLDPEKKLKPTNPIEHDAASDAKAQMDHLIAIFQANSTLLQGAK